MTVRRDILLFVTVAVAALACGWWVLANRPGAALEVFRQEQDRLEAAARPRSPSANTFSATVCIDAPCVVVEAGGLTFVFGAGRAAADGVRQLGLLRPEIDAVLLPDLEVATVEGLPGLATAAAQAGRREPLKVYGPAGLLPVVDGANLIVSASREGRLAAGIEGENQGISGRVVFDSGVVTVRGFGGTERGAGRVYRVDFDGRSLVIAGCTALSGDIVGAAREAANPAAIAMVGSEKLYGPGYRCTDITTVMKTLGQARIGSTMVIPAEPNATTPTTVAAWRDLFQEFDAPGAQLGETGAVLDLSGGAPRFLPARQR